VRLNASQNVANVAPAARIAFLSYLDVE